GRCARIRTVTLHSENAGAVILSAEPSRGNQSRIDDGLREAPRAKERSLRIVPEPPQETGGPSSSPSKKSMRGIDWFCVCVADVQTGFGPFVAVYLTTQKWTQIDIGLVFSIAGLVALASQVPGGMLVDAARSERLVAGLAVSVIALAALTYAAFPVFPAILAAATFHAMASCVLGPAIAAIALGLVGHAGIGERPGPHPPLCSLGNGFAAALMGACGYFFSARSVFIVTALLLLPTILALRQIAPREIEPVRAHGGPTAPREKPAPIWSLFRERSLITLACCVAL